MSNEITEEVLLKLMEKAPAYSYMMALPRRGPYLVGRYCSYHKRIVSIMSSESMVGTKCDCCGKVAKVYQELVYPTRSGQHKMTSYYTIYHHKPLNCPCGRLRETMPIDGLLVKSPSVELVSIEPQ